MRVSVDRDSCISGGRCMATVPAVFDQDEEGLVLLVIARPSAEQEDLVRRAAFLCPAAAISLTEGEEA
jgi:ferredoxin